MSRQSELETMMAADIAVAISDGDAQMRIGGALVYIVADSARNIGASDERGFFESADLIAAGKTQDIVSYGGLAIGKRVSIRLSGEGSGTFSEYQVVDYAEDAAGWVASFKHLGSNPSGAGFR